MRDFIGLVMLLCACGRVGYERHSGADGPGVDAAVDAIDAPVVVDAHLAICPTGTTELMAGSTVCIELNERGNAPWTTAKLDCESLGRRLCTDAEWFLGCTDAVGLTDMIDGGYEWVAEEIGGIAQKRGDLACTVMSTHPIVDPYEYRCCADKL